MDSPFSIHVDDILPRLENGTCTPLRKIQVLLPPRSPLVSRSDNVMITSSPIRDARNKEIALEVLRLASPRQGGNDDIDEEARFHTHHMETMAARCLQRCWRRHFREKYERMMWDFMTTDDAGMPSPVVALGSSTPSYTQQYSPNCIHSGNSTMSAQSTPSYREDLDGASPVTVVDFAASMINQTKQQTKKVQETLAKKQESREAMRAKWNQAAVKSSKDEVCALIRSRNNRNSRAETRTRRVAAYQNMIRIAVSSSHVERAMQAH